MDYSGVSDEDLIDLCRGASNGDWMSGIKAELRRRLEIARAPVTADYGDGPCWDANH